MTAITHSACVHVFALLATTAVCQSASAEYLSIRSDAVRTADSSGFTGYIGGVINASSQSLPSITRANGSSDWTFSDQSFAGLMNFAPASGVDEGALENWMQSHLSGMWEVSWGGGLTNFVNMAPYYTPVASRGYLELTTASIELFEEIKAGGLTGTFTFELAQPGSPLDDRSAYIAGQPLSLSQIVGTSFEMTIESALSQNDTLSLRSGRIDSSVFGLALEHNLSVETVATTIYGHSFIPAPGALALLGLASLVGRRRR
jgi:hypothetical protein